MAAQGDYTHAGGVVVREQHGTREYLLVQSSDATSWVLPKGHIEPGETAEQAAIREVREETGVDADVIAPIGELAFTAGGEPVKTQFFLMRALRSVAQAERRACAWLPFDEARQRMSFEDSRLLLDEGERHLRTTKE